MIDGEYRSTSTTFPLFTVYITELGPEGNCNFMSALAQLDYINGTKTYEDMVVGGLNIVMKLQSTANFPT